MFADGRCVRHNQIDVTNKSGEWESEKMMRQTDKVENATSGIFHMINSLYSFYLFHFFSDVVFEFNSRIRSQWLILVLVCCISLSFHYIYFSSFQPEHISRIWFIRRMKSGIIYFPRWFIFCVHFNRKMLAWLGKNCDELIGWYLPNVYQYLW